MSVPRRAPAVARGLQVERTELAWVRTALVCGALAGLTVRLSDTAATLPALALGLGVAAVGVAAAGMRIAALRRDPAPPPSRTCVALLVAAVVVADLATIVLLLT